MPAIPHRLYISTPPEHMGEIRRRMEAMLSGEAPGGGVELGL